VEDAGRAEDAAGKALNAELAEVAEKFLFQALCVLRALGVYIRLRVL